MIKKRTHSTETDCGELETNAVGRRGFLERSAKFLFAVGVAIGLSSVAKATQKAEKEDFDYQDTPKGDQSCANCVLFDGNVGCAIINGDVSADGWCTAWVD